MALAVANLPVQRARLASGAPERPTWTSEVVIGNGTQIRGLIPAVEIERCGRDVDCEIWVQAASLERIHQDHSLSVDHVREVHVAISSLESR